jgi:hypothetical protein
MNDDPIRMRYQQSAADAAVQGNVGAGHDRPEAVAEDSESC